MVGGWETGYELAGSPLVVRNAWICFRTSVSWVGNNSSLQIEADFHFWDMRVSWWKTNPCNQALIPAYWLPPQVCAQRALFTLKKQLQIKFECVWFVVLDWFDCSKKASWKALQNLWGHLEHFHLGSAAGWSAWASASSLGGSTCLVTSQSAIMMGVSWHTQGICL